ncbi:MAG: WecB/TagA/CpsF family glycosyltransferase, partial [Armatimonadetes bacterium]|nr:WecB/TagA/CpsF family glycosyltransferase [Armatimonadota bacterium]
ELETGTPDVDSYSANEADDVQFPVPDTVSKKTVDILGVKVHQIDMAEAVEIVRGFVASGKPHMVVTADSSMVVLARKDGEFQRLVNSADLVTPDSSGILLAARLLGRPIKERVSGCDLSIEICRIAAQDGFPIYLLGGKPGVAEEAARRLVEMFSGLRIAGTQHGYFEPSQEAEIVAQVKTSGAKILLVGMGIPRQERFIRDHIAELGVCVAMGVGGTLDVISGKVKRAPAWMQRHGLEWLHRLVMNPRKLSKVATLPQFLAMVLCQKLRG